MRLQRSVRALLYALFFCSGGAALSYQMVWSKLFALGLGHEMPAVLAVVSAFMGGMALGAWSLDRRISRSSRPGRWYAGLELLIGAWSLAVTFLVTDLTELAFDLIGLNPPPWWHWSVAFALPFISLLPATAAMGATLPAMDRWLAPLKRDGRCIGGLYAANTLGAVAGIGLSVNVLMPATGFIVTTLFLAGLNLAGGLVALFVEQKWLRLACGPLAAGSPTQAAAKVGAAALSMADEAWANSSQAGRKSRAQRASSSRAKRRSSTDAPSAPFRESLSRRRLSLTVFITGLLGIGYEVVGVRVLSLVLENTVYTFAAVLSVYLLGTAMGAALYQRFGRRMHPRLLLADLLGGLSLSCLVGILISHHAPALRSALTALVGGTRAGAVLVEMLVALAVFALPTCCMGALFSHLLQSAKRPEAGVGQAMALNTLGGALAGALCGVVLLPLVGSKWALVIIAFGYLVLLPKLSGWRWVMPLSALLLTGLLPAHLRLVTVPPGGQLRAYREGALASVAVVEDAAGQRALRVNNHFQMGGTAAAQVEYREALIPLLLHPNPQQALFLGTGTGITLGAATLVPGLRADGVELLPEVVQLMPWFKAANFAADRHPRITMVTADARRFVRAKLGRYDVIVADLFHPARDGAGALYTREHFQAIRRSLSDDSLFCQWLPLHQMGEDTLRMVVRTFLDVFPEGQGWLLQFNVDIPVLGLLGRTQPGPYPVAWREHRVRSAPLERQLKILALGDSLRMYGHLLAGPKELAQFAAHAPLNTDAHPRVTFEAPKFSYQSEAAPFGRLLALLDLPIPDVGALFTRGDSPAIPKFNQRLTDYLRARNIYLRGLIADAEGRQAQAVDAFVDSARLSDDFTPGYAQVLARASLRVRSQPQKARVLLERLIAVQPNRPVAKQMLQRLQSGSDQ